MKADQLPQRWRSTAGALRAVQVAFDVSESVMEVVRRTAFASNLSQPDVVRTILGLPISRRAKRPRLTVSLSQEDYQTLGQRYGLDPKNALAIKERVLAELLAFAQGAEGEDQEQDAE